VIWLNGGPGCIEGLLLENGPMLLDKAGKPRINPHSWHHHANMLYVDQPVGTGFSYTNGPLATSQTEVGTQFVAFLEKFFDIFPDLQYSDVYFTGESFAGIYIPYIATEILKRNKEINETFTDSHTKLKWNLSGIAIGNGWIDPKNQYPAYIEYAAKHKLLSGTHNETAYTLTASCKSKYETSNSLRDLTCERIVDQITDYSKSGNQACMNIYDIRLRDPDNSGVCGASWPFDLPGVYTYLMNPEVVKFLHATNQTKKWRECDDEVFKQLDADRSPPSVTLLPELLKSGVPIHLFSGDMDMICNHIGTERMIENLEWNGAKGFGNVTSQAFSMNKNLIAHVTSARNLTYWLFYNSSHMVPIDQPAGSLAMLYRMIGVEEKYVGSEAYGQMGEVCIFDSLFHSC
ncbi:Alpha/Beta hydrolase protein, partial [Paraphysoderma sedebokerense]